MQAAVPDQKRPPGRPVLVQFGRVGKPHGFRGHFVSPILESTAPALAKIKEIYVGETVETATPHVLLDATWMPKGWKFHVSGIDSDTAVKALRGSCLYLDRKALETSKNDEFFLTDLVGCEVRETGTERVVGVFEGVETVGSRGEAPDRWWIKTATDSFAVPAIKRFVGKVDTKLRIVYLQNLSDLDLE